MQEIRANRLSVLAVIPGEVDQQSVRTILTRSKWKLRLVSTVEEAEGILDEGDTDVVLADSDSLAGSWRRMLQVTGGSASPSVIVASRLGEDALWAEVLNLGGFDVVLKPFDSEELLHTVSMAGRHHRALNVRTAVLQQEIAMSSPEFSGGMPRAES